MCTWSAGRVQVGLAFALAGLVALAGCQSGTDDTATAGPEPDSCTAIPPPAIDASAGFAGPNARAYATRLVCDFSSSPPVERPRVPGTPQAAEAALELAATFQAQGWDAHLENFTGTDYEAIPKSSLAAFAQCQGAERDRVRGLSFSNVVADRGSGLDLYIFLAHFDSKRFANKDPAPELRQRPVLGANDGASGVGVLLEAGRVWGASDWPFQVRLLLVDGEDGFEDCHPTAGSLFHAYHMSQAERNRTRAVILLDMVGDAEARFCLAHNSEMLRDAWASAASNASVPAVADAPRCSVLDDHVPFADLGMPALDLIDFQRPSTSFPPYWHTTHDTPDKLSAEMMGDVGRVLVSYVDAING